jgi:hypothetical protein
VIRSKRTTSGSAREGRLKIAIYGIGGLLFVTWIASGLISSTELVSGVPAYWNLPIVVMCCLEGAALGYALSVGRWRFSSATTKKAGTLFSTCILALFYGVIGHGLAERAANSVMFWGHDVDTHISVQPVMVVGIGRGAKRYVELAGFGRTRFEISRFDFEILAASAREHASPRYCLPVVTQRVGDAVRVRLPDEPRPTLSETSERDCKMQKRHFTPDVNFLVHRHAGGGRYHYRLFHSGHSAFAQLRTPGVAIRAPDNGHSLSAIFPVSPCPTPHFGKEQLETDFGNESAPNGSSRDRLGDFPAIGSLWGRRVCVIQLRSASGRPEKDPHPIIEEVLVLR